jgi:hypothetical protein
MDREVIEQKLELLRRCLQRIEGKCPADAQTLATDPDLQDIVALNLNRAVQVCVRHGRPPHCGYGRTAAGHHGANIRLTRAGWRFTRSVGKQFEKGRGFSKYRRAQLRKNQLAHRAQHCEEPSCGLFRICQSGGPQMRVKQDSPLYPPLIAPGVLVSDTAEITNGDGVLMLSENQSTYIPLGEKHRLASPGKVPLEIIEVQSGSYLGEHDIVRFEDT